MVQKLFRKLLSANILSGLALALCNQIDAMLISRFLGYCYGAKEKDRLVGGIRFSALFGLSFCAVISALCYIFAELIVKIFLTDMTALESGVHFTQKNRFFKD